MAKKRKVSRRQKEQLFKGVPPAESPSGAADFDELEKKSIDALVDALKYLATTSGIVLALYSKSVQDFIGSDSVLQGVIAKTIVFLPLLFWVVTIVATIVGIFPRVYRANSDLEKERAVFEMRKTKRVWLRIALLAFLIAFVIFLYVMTAQLYTFFPFG